MGRKNYIPGTQGADAAATERKRVKKLIEQDHADRAAMADIISAQKAIEGGADRRLNDGVMPPTREWLRQHESASYMARGEGRGSENTAKTVRRVLTPAVVRMWRAGKLTDEMAAACLWYREMHDQAGLEGRYCTTRYSDVNGTGGTGGGGAIAMTLAEAEARRAFRAARHWMPDRFLKFFDAITLDDASVFQVWGLSRGIKRKAPARFRQLAAHLLEHCEREGVDLSHFERNVLPG